ncbi:class I tRNA ligase family protein [Candidatus Wolfebacteria bacterium]|nr:class I tRNA ligase family protein [Candidatus Wolfebacteria bacterium]
MSDKSDFAKREEEVLDFWNKENIFQKSLSKKSPKGVFTFYDGPPFATGLPHFGHVLASTIKDAIPRYKTMQGFTVPRRWGWDCHGLPLEAQVEKEFNVSTKQEIIDDIGIENFVERAKKVVLTYRDDWKKIIPRLGRFVDMENDYRTMDPSYTESVWWVFKTLYNKELIYKGFKVLHLSPLLGTELSNIEVAQGYKDITDFAVTVKLPIKGEDTSLLVWTTTPWTLPGNTAAAVHSDLTYVKVKVTGSEKLDGTYILSKEKLSLFEEVEHTVLEEMKGKDLVGKEYEPPFNYYKDKDIEGKENAWKIYAADYVTEESGTGAVHIAPAFGAEDLELAQKFGIPIVHHINKSGKFVDEVTDFKGMDAKPKDDHQATDIEIIKYLAHAGKLFKKEKIKHSYPHSWRTDEPLLNYAMDSWFVNAPKITKKLVAENEKVNWVPKEIGSKRFGNWLKGGKEWSISRSRFWGAPLPVWESKEGSRIVLGGIEDLKKNVKKSGNTYTIMRHGEAQTNAAGMLTHNDSIPSDLTDAGRAKALETAKELQGITKIIASPLKRTQQTAKIVAAEIGMSEKDIITEERLREINFGIFNGKSVKEYHAFFETNKDLMFARPEGAESWCDVKKRVGEFLYEIENTYKNETILIVTHNSPAFMLARVMEGHDLKMCAEVWEKHKNAFVLPGTTRDLPFVPIPHNAEYELDFHRPFIDEIILEKNGEEYTRILDVFDCWFESGAMPYGQKHFPYENLDTFNPKGGLFSKPKGYPAQFIAEGVDQTRGWFYSLIVLGVGLFGKAPFENVIVNGMVLGEDGKKLAKKLKNYSDPIEVVDMYGADALRYYMLSSSIVRGEDLVFTNDGVKEISQKITGRLHNVFSFYSLYESVVEKKKGNTNVLDTWITSRLHQLIKDTERGYDAYELDKATRPLLDFIDDLSTWYVRRSRDRIKNGGEDAAAALYTLHKTLLTLSKVMAPTMPFYAEYLYRNLKEEQDIESVHLCDWPTAGPVDEKVLSTMKRVRGVVSDALMMRQKAGFKVRQPLNALTLPERVSFSKEYQTIIREEVNVENIVFSGTEMILDTELTPALVEKGMVRDFIRAVQDARKKADFSPHDKAILTIAGPSTFLDAYKEDIMSVAGVEKIQRVQELPGGAEVEVGDKTLTILVAHA